MNKRIKKKVKSKRLNNILANAGPDMCYFISDSHTMIEFRIGYASVTYENAFNRCYPDFYSDLHKHIYSNMNLLSSEECYPPKIEVMGKIERIIRL